MPRDINRDLGASYTSFIFTLGTKFQNRFTSPFHRCGLVSLHHYHYPLLHCSFLNPTPYNIIMNRNLLLSLALFLLLTVATFFSVHFELSSRLQQRKQIEVEDDQAFEQEILRREQEWAEMEMARYEQAHGFRPVRLEKVEEQPTPQTESSLRGDSSNDDTKDKKKSVKPF
jgi:hypothetical protein